MSAIVAMPRELEDDLPGLCRWAVAQFGASLALATSLANEDMVLLHALDVAARDLPSAERPVAFLLDTGRLHEETYVFMDRVRARFSLPLQVFAPDASALQTLYATQGAYGFRGSVEARKACCDARKVQPLARALQGRAAWMTGLRREQSPARQDVRITSADGALLKLAPLAAWNKSQVGDYLREHRVPQHPLHAEGFPSIGCAPCTRAVTEGEPDRAGRWWWESPDSKECGLHPIRRRQA